MVMKDGRTVDGGTMAGMTSDGLVASMLGQDGKDRTEAPARAATRARAGARPAAGAPVLVASGAASAGVSDVDFTIRPGEIIGVAGLRGSGQTELCRLIAGVDRLTAGRVEFHEQPFAPKTPADAVTSGVSYLPQERKSEGLFLNLSVAQNISVAPAVRKSVHWVTRRGESRLAEDAKRDLDIRLPGGKVTTPVSALSGGNQQKVVLARCLAARPSLLVLDEPTRGVDVGAKAQIHQLIRDQADKGLSVVVSSSELDELLTLANRILVLHRGRMVADLSGDALSEHAVLAAASGEAA
jgi:ABC-type sugar transport system ATPase subunit